MKSIYSLIGLLMFAASGCDDNVGETIESSYLENRWEEPTYKFVRNGKSSVDTQECQFLKDPLDYFYSGFMKRANIRNESSWERARKYYEEGEYGLKPMEELSASPLHREDRKKVLEDFKDLIEGSKRISGFYQKDEDNRHRNREAHKGVSGFIGLNIADANILFVDDKGVAIAEQFHYAVMGAVYLDKILNLHLNEEVIFSPENCKAHTNLELIRGKNYTAVEHHLDLAFGYYQFWKPFAISEGIPALKDCDRKIFYALVESRRLIERSQFDLVKEQIRIIREELSKVAGARAISLLVGANTEVNVQEEVRNAFGFISQSLGMIYSLQFTRGKDGLPYFSYNEVKEMIQNLSSDEGLWNKDRLTADEQQTGSLKNIASRIGQRFGISLKDIER